MTSTLEKLVARVALGLPGAWLDHPFGPDVDVYKSGKKMFLLVSHMPESARPGGLYAQVKVPPEDVAGLVRLDGVEPAWHMSRTHWVRLLIEDGSPVSEQLLAELVEDSYAAVSARRPEPGN